MAGFLDIHHHIVYGVDDGPATAEDAVRMLHKAQENGVTHIIGTSHALPALEPFPAERYYRHLARLNGLCRERGLLTRVYDGCEIFYSPIAIRQLEERRLPTLAGSRFALIEFDPTSRADAIIDALRQIANAGFIPVVAHVERYEGLAGHPAAILDARGQFPLRLQMNGATLLRRAPRALRKFRDLLLQEDAIDYIASDAHNASSRPVNLRDAYDWLTKTYDARRAVRLTFENPKEIFTQAAGARRG